MQKLTTKASKNNKISDNSHENNIRAAEYFVWAELDGRYQFTRYLGHFSTCHIAQGKHINTGKKVRLKKVLPIFAKTINAKQLLREIKILQALQGLDNIVQLIDVLPPQNFSNFTQIILILEFVDTNLHNLIHSDQYFTSSHVQYILYQILLGLNWMHSLNIFHQNLKPKNILVNENCSVKISDLDLVCCRFDKINKPVYKKPSLAFQVNYIYSAPEVILLQQKTECLGAADIWSVGCIFAELLQMLRDNLFPYKSRRPLFVQMGDNITVNRLKTIFSIIGTVTPDEMWNIDNDRLQKLLMQIPKCLPVDFTNMYPGNDEQTLSLLRGFLQFDVDKRITVNEALRHPFIQHVRDKQNEMKCAKIINRMTQSDSLDFKFEDMNMTINMYRSLIIEQVLKYSKNFSPLVVSGYINKYYSSLLMPFDIIMLINRYYIIDEI